MLSYTPCYPCIAVLSSAGEVQHSGANNPYPIRGFQNAPLSIKSLFHSRILGGPCVVWLVPYVIHVKLLVIHFTSLAMISKHLIVSSALGEHPSLVKESLPCLLGSIPLCLNISFHPLIEVRRLEMDSPSSPLSL